MKRLLILFVVIVTALSLLALPIAADEASNAGDPKQTTSVSNENNNNGNKNEDKNVTLTDVFNSINDIAKYFKQPIRILEFIRIDISRIPYTTMLNGGYNYFNGKDNPINLMISTLYNITYPIGIIAMILAWIFGIAKSSTNTALDIKDKNSLIRSMLGLVIGLAAMTAAPYVLTVLTSISNWLCVRISSISISSYLDIYNEDTFLKMTEDNVLNLYDFINNYFIDVERAKETAKGLELEYGSPQYYSIGYHFIYGIIVVIVIEFVFCLNMLWLALLQVVSPIFIGLCASGMARKFTFNFIKEYFKALLMPVLSLIYTTLCIAMLGTDTICYILKPFERAGSTLLGGIGMVLVAVIFPLVLAISTLGIAGKKLDKLIN